MNRKPWHLIALATHPIQYRSPLFRHLARQPWLKLEVWYGHDYGVKPGKSAWGVPDFAWDVNLLDGYCNRFLVNRSPFPTTAYPYGILTRGLGRALSRSRPDAVWISGYGVAYQWQGFASAWRQRIPILYSSDSNVMAEAGGPKRWVKRAAVTRLYRGISAFLVSGTTNDEHFALYGVPPEKRFRMPWAVDNAFFEAAADRHLPERAETRKPWQCGERDVVLFVGRLSPEKNATALLSAARLLPNTHLVFAGSGPQQRELERQASRGLEGRCTFLGFVPQSKLPAIYAAADVMVLPSHYEPWGLVVNESLACGCPVVASKLVGAARDLVPEELRFDPREPLDLVRAIRAWRARRDRGPDLREWARGQVAGFDFAHDALGLEAALSAVAAPRK